MIRFSFFSANDVDMLYSFIYSPLYYLFFFVVITIKTDDFFMFLWL